MSNAADTKKRDRRGAIFDESEEVQLTKVAMYIRDHGPISQFRVEKGFGMRPGALIGSIVNLTNQENNIKIDGTEYLLAEDDDGKLSLIKKDSLK